jgi:hypothetical protein
MLYDPVRKKNVCDTPEERVRQQILMWLLGIGVPALRIHVEFYLGLIHAQEKGRADIVVWPQGMQQGMQKPLLLVECKRPQVAITQDIESQLHRYLHRIQPDFIWISNGTQNYCYELQANTYEYCATIDTLAKALKVK